MKTTILSKKRFLKVIKNTPLVSIDLVIKDLENNIWLGKRVNEPAIGKWFVPGGRILKGESLNDAFERITLNEIGYKHSLNEARLLGAFTHIYSTNVFCVDGISTHYVVLAYEIILTNKYKIKKLTQQHYDYKWFSAEDVDPLISKKVNKDVHKNVLEYFRIPSNMTKDNYQILNARRDSYNNLVWQTPMLSLTAQAFLFIIILSGGVPFWGRLISIILSIIVAIMSIQLFNKHRFMENEHARILHAYEEVNRLYPANRVLKSSNWTIRIPSRWLWKAVLWSLIIASIGSLILLFMGKLDP